MKAQLLELIFPPRCVVCGEVLTMEERSDFLCSTCRGDIPYVPQKICPRCGGKTETTGFCEPCRKPYAFESACAAFPYEVVRDAIHLFKYEGGIKIGEGLGKLMAAYLRKEQEELPARIDVMLSVPLYPKKEKNRGFNQTHILCGEIAKETGLFFQKDGLFRKRETSVQSLLDPEERKRNIAGAFAVTADFTGKRILLVDDIFTTGTTCNECARELYRAGAKEVMVFCLSATGGKPTEEEPPEEKAF